MDDLHSPVQIEIADNVATLRVRPGCAPILGCALLAVVAVTTFLLLGGLDDPAGVSWLTYAFAWAVGGAIFFGGLYALHRSRYPIARFSASTRTIEMIRWVPLRRNKRLRWDQLLAVATAARTRKDGTTEFGMILVTRDGGKLPLTPRSYSDGSACDDAARAINRFMNNA